ncbi:MAG: polysaccharide biosynthesis C-terminal domain-containing protein [Ferruginibacter sp.]
MSSFKSKLLNGFTWRLGLYASSFILNIFIANNFGAEGSGIFYLLLNNIAFVVLFTSLGLDSAIAYFTSRKEIGTSQLLSLSIVWSLVASGALVLLYFACVQLNIVAPYDLAPFIIINIGCTLLANCVASILFATDDNSTPGLTFTLINVLLIVLLPGVLVNNIVANTEYIKLYLFVTALPAVVFVACLYFRSIRFGVSRPDNYWLKKIASFSLQSFVNNMFYALLLRCDYWLVNYYSTDNDLGNYLQATKLTQIILLVPTLASFSLFPLITSHIHQSKKIDTKLLKLVSIYFYIGVVMCTGVIAVGYWVFPLLYGQGFSKMYLCFVLLSPGVLMLAAAFPIATFFSGKNQIRLRVIALFFSIVLLVVLDLLLIPRFNIYGAAIAGTVAYSFYFFYLLFQFKKLHDFQMMELLDIRPILQQNFLGLFTKKNKDED